MKRDAAIFTGPPLTRCVADLVAGGSGERKGGLVVVVGSGPVARKLAAAGHRVAVVVDTPGQAERIEAWCAKETPAGRLWVVRAGAQALPFKDGSAQAMVAVSVLGGLHKKQPVEEIVRSWSRTVRPRGTVALGEMAGEGWAARVLLRLTRKVKGRVERLEPSRLCALLLEAGVRGIEQVWPQGVGSYVLTYGRVGPLAGLKGPVDLRDP